MLLLCALPLCGCAQTRRVALYVPADDTLAVVHVPAEPTPAGLIAALQAHGALPDAETDYLYCACADEPDGDDPSKTVRVVRLDISDSLGAALSALPDARPAVQALADTFLDFYGADQFVLTIEGVNLQTLQENFNDAITFDEYVRAES